MLRREFFNSILIALIGAIFPWKICKPEPNLNLNRRWYANFAKPLERPMWSRMTLPNIRHPAPNVYSQIFTLDFKYERQSV